MMRGNLVTLIFEKTLRMSTTAVGDSGAITLMSTDIERISSCLREIHEVYCSLIEITLALWLLARLLNWAIIAPTVFVICMSSAQLSRTKTDSAITSVSDSWSTLGCLLRRGAGGLARGRRRTSRCYFKGSRRDEKRQNDGLDRDHIQ